MTCARFCPFVLVLAWASLAGTAEPGRAVPGTAGTSSQPPREVRALWVTRTTLTSPVSITTMVRSAARAGFNTLLVQVRGRGDAYFAGGREPRAAALGGQPEPFDPLRTVLAEAHAADLHVHAWVNINLVASATDLPRSRAHVVNRHPDWLMVPRPLAAELGALNPTTPAYRDKLTQWTRAQAQQVEGLYLSPVPPDAADYTVSVIGNLAARYPLDGVHFDYVRYPSEAFDYSRAALDEFRAETIRRLTAAERTALDRRRARDPLAYADAFPLGWRAFHTARLTRLVARLSQEVRRRRPRATVTAAVVPDGFEAAERKFQKWAVWLADGTLDAACPMAYATDAAGFEAQLTAARTSAAGRPLWAGIGAYRLTAAQTIENIRAARRHGFGGVVLFSYDSLATPPGGADEYLGSVGRATFER